MTFAESHRLLACDVQALDLTGHVLQLENVQADLHKYRLWSLITGGGYYTYPHVDGSGLCTWISVTHGSKYWAILHMADSGFRAGKTSTRLRHKQSAIVAAAFERYKKIASASNDYLVAPIKLPGLATVYVIKLEPGMLACVHYPYLPSMD